MRSNRSELVTGLLVMCFLAAGTAFGTPQDQKTKLKGMIIARSGDTMIVKNPDGNTTVVLDDSTKTKDDKGLFGLDKQYMSNVVLIPGLKVKVDGVTSGEGRVLAKTITVDGDDLETAEMIQAGLHPTAEQVAANEAQLAAHSQDITANAKNIQANRQDISASKISRPTHSRFRRA